MVARAPHSWQVIWAYSLGLFLQKQEVGVINQRITLLHIWNLVVELRKDKAIFNPRRWARLERNLLFANWASFRVGAVCRIRLSISTRVDLTEFEIDGPRVKRSPWVISIEIANSAPGELDGRLAVCQTFTADYSIRWGLNDANYCRSGPVKGASEVQGPAPVSQAPVGLRPPGLTSGSGVTGAPALTHRHAFSLVGKRPKPY